jgi:dolichol-phosphate mannosyltransferase
MKLRAKRNGFRLQEVPITFVDRELGTSKMSMNIFREALLGVLQMRYKRIFFPPANNP